MSSRLAPVPAAAHCREKAQDEARAQSPSLLSTVLLKFTGFEILGFALGVLAPQIFRLERTRSRFSKEMPLKTEHTATF